MRALKYEILRGLIASGTKVVDVPVKPLRVATLVNEKLFLESGGAMVHNETVFFEEYLHDWNWNDGKFRYYTRVAAQADVLLVYELDKTPVTLPGRFCTMCGHDSQTGQHDCKEGQ